MRRRDREVTDVNQIIKILDTCKVVHLGLVDDGIPYIIPMNYGYDFEDGHLTLYLHGSKEGRKVDIIQKNSTCCIEMECNTTLIEDDIACKNGMSYESIMGEGTVTIIDDSTQKVYALENLMRVQTGKDFPMDERHAMAVNIFRVDVPSITAKHRPMPPM